MSATPRGRSSSHRRARCKCLARGCKGDRATPCCSFNPLRSLFRCPGGRGRSRSRGNKHRQRTPSRVRDAPAGGAAVLPQQGQEEEPSFFVYAMPNQGGFGGGAEQHKKKKRRKPRMPSFGSCFRSNKKKKERKQAKAAASAPRPALTPASSLLTHPPGSPSPPEKTPAASPSMTQPPSPAPTEIGSAVNSPAPPGRQPATLSTDAARSPLAPPRMQQQPKQQVEGLEIMEVATGERLSAHELSLIEMVGSSAESSVKSSLEYANEPPPPPAAAPKRTAVEREAEVVKKVREVPKLWLNGKSAESRARERFAKPLVPAEAEELWAHDVACSRVHASMLAETVRS
ncbi:unnamed protein product [Urochloa decumbens]|uniref:Uncharacterized protein n=1 Tax=Urochloa decumbens TaxID=240449 RepID=A0ABC8XSX6_9POAL